MEWPLQSPKLSSQSFRQNKLLEQGKNRRENVGKCNLECRAGRGHLPGTVSDLASLYIRIKVKLLSYEQDSSESGARRCRVVGVECYRSNLLNTC